MWMALIVRRIEMSLKCIATLGVGLTLSALSSAGMLDNFTFGVPQSVVVHDNRNRSDRITDPGIWGGYRQIEIQNNNVGTSRVDVVSGSATISFGESLTGGSLFQYSQGRSSDWSWMKEWKISISSVTRTMRIGVFFQSFPTFRLARFERTIGPRTTSFTETITLADSTDGQIDLTEMTHMRFYFLTDIPEYGAQLTLTSLEAVPEPSTGLVALAGVLLIGRNTRRRRK